MTIGASVKICDFEEISRVALKNLPIFSSFFNYSLREDVNEKHEKEEMNFPIFTCENFHENFSLTSNGWQIDL